jgi:membrane-associated phospholipid phosphatase
MNWSAFLRNKHFRNELIISVFVLALTLTSLAKFLNYVESRNGITLPDPILKLFNSVNLTWLTFILIYLSIILILFLLSSKPKRLIFAVQCYIILILIRIFMMYLVPLNPPAGMILLNDPFVQYFGTGQPLTKDLFFSGHTATIFLFYLVSDKNVYKTFFLIATILVGISVLLQHVHYSIDVVSAPFFAYISYRLIYSLHSRTVQYSLL